MRKLRGRERLVAAVFALAIVPLAVTGIAMALTPSLGVLTDANTTTTVKFDDGPFKMKIREPIRVRNAHVGVAAGLETVWHTHPGPEIISVKEGTLNILVARTRPGDDQGGGGGGGRKLARTLRNDHAHGRTGLHREPERAVPAHGERRGRVHRRTSP